MRANHIALATAAAAALLTLAACGKKDDAAPPAAPALTAAVTSSMPSPAVPASAASVAAAPASAPQASTDPDAPTPLTAREVKGQGQQAKLSYYYGFSGGPGTLKLTATAKNKPSGATNALTIGLYDARANRLCYETAGNTTTDKTFSVNCAIDKAQPLILRLDLAEDTIDFAASVEGPLTLASADAAAKPVVPPAGACSSDIDAPTRLATNRLKDAGKGQIASHYCTFNAGPGELTLTIDGRNSAAAVTEALQVGLYTLRSEKICNVALGNTTLDKRAVQACAFDKRQPVILRIDASAETLDWRVRFEGPHDFEPYEPPKDITIALDAAALFDTGKAVIRPEAKVALREAAERIRKFANAPVAISGHTDNVGKDAANQALSEQRAQAVREYLGSQEGVPAARMTAKGYGKSQPVADNATDAGRARNRRVDIVISARTP